MGLDAIWHACLWGLLVLGGSFPGEWEIWGLNLQPNCQFYANPSGWVNLPEWFHFLQKYFGFCCWCTCHCSCYFRVSWLTSIFYFSWFSVKSVFIGILQLYIAVSVEIFDQVLFLLTVVGLFCCVSSGAQDVALLTLVTCYTICCKLWITWQFTDVLVWDRNAVKLMHKLLFILWLCQYIC